MNYYLSTPLYLLKERLPFLMEKDFQPEIRMDDAAYLSEIEEQEIVSLNNMLNKRSFNRFAHGPFFGLDVASIDPNIARYSIDMLIRGLEVSSSLGASVMVIHTGFLPQFSRYGRSLWFQNWSERMPLLVREASRYGVTLALENTWDHRPEIILRLIDLLPGDEVAVCLDTGHLNTYSQEPLKRWWKILGGKIVAIHLHDNDGLSDDHLLPGRGTFDFYTLVKLIYESGQVPLLDFELQFGEAEEGKNIIDDLMSRVKVEYE